jgi:hypothetical protein
MKVVILVGTDFPEDVIRELEIVACGRYTYETFSALKMKSGEMPRNTLERNAIAVGPFDGAALYKLVRVGTVKAVKATNEKEIQ